MENESKQNAPEIDWGVGDVFYYKFVSLMIRRSELWKPICDFARWMEYDAAPLAIQRNEDEIWIDLDPEANIERLWIGEIEDHEILLQYRVLWKYLVSLGVRKLCLGPRLEMNQIQDFFVFIKSREKVLLSRERKHHNAVSAGLANGQSIHFSCANVILQDNIFFTAVP